MYIATRRLFNPSEPLVFPTRLEASGWDGQADAASCSSLLGSQQAAFVTQRLASYLDQTSNSMRRCIAAASCWPPCPHAIRCAARSSPCQTGFHPWSQVSGGARAGTQRNSSRGKRIGKASVLSITRDGASYMVGVLSIVRYKDQHFRAAASSSGTSSSSSRFVGCRKAAEGQALPSVHFAHPQGVSGRSQQCASASLPGVSSEDTQDNQAGGFLLHLVDG